MKKVFILLAALISLANVMQAAPAQKKLQKETTTTWKQVPAKQTAIGFSSQFSNVGLNSFALRHWLSSDNALEGVLGFSFGDNLKVIDIGGKYIGVIKQEPSLKFYGFGALGIENCDQNGESNTGVLVGGGLGWEFFFSGLSNLAFNIEFGMGYNSTPGIKSFGTSGYWLPAVGIRYYL